jgi:hypothetical protein
VTLQILLLLLQTRAWLGTGTEKQVNVIEMFGRLHSDICKAQTFILPGVTVNVRLIKGRREYYLMAKDADSNVKFKLREAQVFFRLIAVNDSILYAHNKTLEAGAPALYHMTRVEVKTFTFAAGSQFLSIDNAVLGPLLKRILFTLVINKDFLGTLDSNPYNFRHYGIREFELYVNGRQIPSEG